MSESAFGVVHKAYTPNPKVMTELHSLAGQIANPKKKLTRFQVSQKLSAQAGDKESLRWAKTQEARNSTFGKADDNKKRNTAIAGGVGATALGVGIAPIKMDVPEPKKKTHVSGSNAKVSDLRRIATHEGKRFGNDSHIAGLARNIRDKGYDKSQPIEVVRYKNGAQRVVGGHHRLAAMEMLGERKVPIKITDSEEKRARVSTSLIGMRRKKKAIEEGRKARPKMNNKDIDALADKKVHPILRGINSFHSQKGNVENSYNVSVRPHVERAARNPKVVAPVAGAGLGAAYLHNKKKIERFSKSLWRGMALKDVKRLKAAGSLDGHPGAERGDIGPGVYFARQKRYAQDYARPAKNGHGRPNASRRIGAVAEFEEGKTRPAWEGNASPKWSLDAIRRMEARHPGTKVGRSQMKRTGRGGGATTYQQVTYKPQDMKKLKLKRIESVNATTVERSRITRDKGTMWNEEGLSNFQRHKKELAGKYGGSKEERRARIADSKRRRETVPKADKTGAAWRTRQVIPGDNRTIYRESFGKMDSMSTSAFGVDHGDISKGVGPTGPVRRALPKVRPLGPGLGKAKPSTQETLRAKVGQAYRDAAKAKAGPGQAGRPRQPGGSRSRYNFTRAIDDL